MALVLSPQQTPSQAPHGSDGPVNSQGLVNVYVSALMLYSQDFLPFFSLCQPDKVWKIQLMTFMTEAGWRKAEKGGIVTIRGGHLGKM